MLGEIEGFSDDEDATVAGNKSQHSAVSQVYDDGDDPMGIANPSILPIPEETEETSSATTQQIVSVPISVTENTVHPLDEKMEDVEEEDGAADVEDDEHEVSGEEEAESEMEETATGEDAIVLHETIENPTPTPTPAPSASIIPPVAASIPEEIVPTSLPTSNDTGSISEPTAVPLPVKASPPVNHGIEPLPLYMEEDEPPTSPMPPRPGSPSSDSAVYGDDVYSSASDDDESQEDEDEESESDAEATTSPADTATTRQTDMEYLIGFCCFSNRFSLLKDKEREVENLKSSISAVKELQAALQNPYAIMVC